MIPFVVASGSVPGTDHTKPGQSAWTNNHDAVAHVVGKDHLVAVVADGCGSGAHSEIGSGVGVQLVVTLISDMVENIVHRDPEPVLDESFWERIATMTVGHLAVLARSMGRSISTIVNDYLLFTLVGIVVLPCRTYVFSLGDGMYAVNGRIELLGPFPNNSPPYLMYRLTGSSLGHHDPAQLRIKVNEIIPTSTFEHGIIGTDGVCDLVRCVECAMPQRNEVVGPLSQFWTDVRYVRNADMIRRRLALMNKEYAVNNRIMRGLLHDDTTLALVRRLPPQGEGA